MEATQNLPIIPLKNVFSPLPGDVFKGSEFLPHQGFSLFLPLISSVRVCLCDAERHSAQRILASDRGTDDETFLLSESRDPFFSRSGGGFSESFDFIVNELDSFHKNQIATNLRFMLRPTFYPSPISCNAILQSRVFCECVRDDLKCRKIFTLQSAETDKSGKGGKYISSAALLCEKKQFTFPTPSPHNLFPIKALSSFPCFPASASLCPKGHISFSPTSVCRMSTCASTSAQNPPKQLHFPHLCPNGHLSFREKNFCSFTNENISTKAQTPPKQESTMVKGPRTLVLRLRGGGGIEVPIPEIFVPKIHFDLVELEGEAKELPRMTFSQLLQKIYIEDPSFSDLCPYAQIDTISNKFTTKVLEEFLKSFFSTLKLNTVTLVLIMKTQNIPRDPLAFLTRDTRPFVQISLPFLKSAHLNLQPGKPGVLVAVLYKEESTAPISRVYHKKGIVPALSGTNQVIGIETVVRVNDEETQHRQIFSQIFPGLGNEINSLIVCGKKVVAEYVLLRFIFFTKRENFSALSQLAEESWGREEKSFWIADINLLDSICGSSFDFFLLSGYLPDFLSSGTKKVIEISKLTTTKVLSIIPKNHSSLFIVTEKGTQDFCRLLLENSFKILVLSSKGAKEIPSSGLMVYPIPNSKDAACVMSPEELKKILEQLFQTKSVESRNKGFRVFCDKETLETWRSFEGFLSYQKVRMCKEREKEKDRSRWWGSLRGQEKDKINEKRRVSLLRVDSSQITHSIPATKRRRDDC